MKMIFLLVGFSSSLALAAPKTSFFHGLFGTPAHPELVKEILDKTPMESLIAIAKSGAKHAFDDKYAVNAARTAAGRASLTREANNLWLVDLVRNENNGFGDLIERAAFQRTLTIIGLSANPTALLGELSLDDRLLLIRKILIRSTLSESMKAELVLRLGARSEVSEAIERVHIDDPVAKDIKAILQNDSAYEVFKARKAIRLKDINPILGSGPDLFSAIRSLPGGSKAIGFNCEILFRAGL